MSARLALATGLDRRRGTHFARSVVAELEPHVPWTDEFLRTRLTAYTQAKDPMSSKAEADWMLFSSRAGRPLVVSTREQLAEIQRHQDGNGVTPSPGPAHVHAREP